MPTPPPPPAAVPELTEAAVNRLIARLGGRLDAVEKSTAPDATKKEVRILIVTIMSTLLNGVQGGAVLIDWVSDLAPKFKTLGPLLKTALGLRDDNLGACFYQKDGRVICVMTTDAECKDNGLFVYPGTCP